MPNERAAKAAVLLRGAAAGLAILCLGSAAQAGGYDTGERDWDFLFQPDEFAVEAGTRYIDPQRSLKNVVGIGAFYNGAFPTTASVREAAPFSVEHLNVKVTLAQALRCLGSYRQPWEGRADYGSTWAGSAAAITQDFSSNDYGLTCAISAPLEMGNLVFFGGVSYQDIRYELTQNAFMIAPGPTIVPLGVSRTDVKDDGVGWRIGMGYEIPQYALRATLTYNSAIDYDMAGTYTVAGLAQAVTGQITMPQSIQLKAQSGIAPGWLAFGSITWTDWSVVQQMPLFNAASTQVSGLTLLWKDTWTTTLGAAHQFNEAFSVAGSVTWDQGASQGFTSQTDVWAANLTGVWTPHKNVEFNLGGTVGIMTGGYASTVTLPGGIPNPTGYTASFDADMIYAVNASAKLHY